VDITVVEIQPAGEFGGHIFEYESDSDLFKCVNPGCSIYEIVARANAREQGIGEITSCPAVSGMTDASATTDVGGQTPFPADAHTGWSCDAGASLIAEAWHRPGPGRLGTLHGVIYVCPAHQADAERRISGADLSPEVHPAPPDHRHDPWPCGHVTIYDTEGESLRRDTGVATTVGRP
jgi:hypothetical protein